MPSEVRVKTGFGEYVYRECQLSEDKGTLLVKRDGVPLLWASWPWEVIFT
jgi:hypothetical protein